MFKKLLICGVILSCAVAQAESTRTALTKDNRLPRLQQAEIGVEAYHMEFKNNAGDAQIIMPYLRYTLLQDLAVYANFPYLQVNPEVGRKESGLGDVSLGVDFIVYKDLFGYPWIMPYAAVLLDTGDADKGLGTGSTDYVVGVAIGTTVNRNLHFIADGRYLILSNEDNIPAISGSLVWDLDRKFSLIAEMELQRLRRRDEFGKDDSHPIMFMAGMHYRASRDLQFTLHAGTTQNLEIESIIRGKVSYSF